MDWAERWIRAMHDRLSRFTPSSEVSRFNRDAGRWTEVSPDLHSLLEAGLWAYRASGGLVHIGVLRPLLATGYRRPLRQGPLPVDVHGMRPPASLPEMLWLRPGRARLAPGSGVDLGGLAKGWMADRLAAWLGGRCLVNLGGDLRVSGQGWPIGFGATTVLMPDGAGAATSSTRKRRWRDDGAVVHHLIDPRTGRPSASGLSEVSVIADTALEAEMLAKTALLLGAADGPAFLAANARAWRTCP